jgi:hypothetical protein
MTPRLHLLLALATTGALHAGTSAIVAASSKNPKAPQAAAILPQSSSGWRVSAGGQWRTLGDASFSNSSQAPGYLLPLWAAEADALASAGGLGGGYSDGYVLPDISGSTATTWNFGYTSASQIVGGNLVLHGNSGGGISTYNSQLYNSDWSDNMNGWGGFVKLETPELFSWRGISLSAVVGYGYTRADIDHSALAFTATQRTSVSGGGGSYTDSYTAIGALPPAPHVGTFAGPGPILSLTPVRSFSGGGNGTGNTTETSVESIIRNRFDVDLHTLSFGPQLTFQTILPKLNLGGSLGLALNIADWNARTDETLSTTAGHTLAAWHSHSNGTDVLPGFYLEANAAYALSSNWSVSAFGRYDWSEALQGHTGTSTVALDLTGWTLGLGATYRF